MVISRMWPTKADHKGAFNRVGSGSRSP